MADYIPKPDQEAVAFGERVVAAMEAAPADYGLEAADVAPLRAKLTALKTKLAASDAAKAAANTAVADKDNARKDFEAALRPVVQQVQLKPEVTDASRQAAGIPIRDKVRTVNAPVAPRDLVATADGGGVVSLKFNSNGNSSGVSFVIEKKPAGAADFSLAEVTTRTLLKLNGFPVGQRCEFRVKARRGETMSAASNVAAVY